MNDVYADGYWRDEFQVTQADLDRLAGRMAFTTLPAERARLLEARETAPTP